MGGEVVGWDMLDLEVLPKWRDVAPLQLSPVKLIQRLQRRYSVRLGRGDEARVLYLPLPKQAVGHALSQPNVLYGGAFAGGKSMWLRWGLIMMCLWFPGFRALLMRRDRTDLETSQLIDVEQEVPKQVARYVKGRAQLQFPNGSLIQFGHCATEETFKKWLSSQWDAIALDEASTFTPTMLTNLQMRLRTKRPHLIRPQYLLASNPGGPGHNWLRSRAMLKKVPEAEDASYDPALWAYLHAVVEDNTFIDPEHAQRLETLPPDRRRAYRLGDWSIFIGQFFTSISPTIHEFSFPDDMPRGWEWWPKYRAYDWGYAKPACMLWFTVDPKGSPWLYRELYGAEYEIEDFMAEVVRLSAGDCKGKARFEWTVADPSCWNRDSKKTKAHRALEAGVPMIPASRSHSGKGSRVDGWDLMRRYLNPETTPMLRIAKQCENWWWTVPTLISDEKNPEDVDTDLEDHAADATRYGLMHLPVTFHFEKIDAAGISLHIPGEPGTHFEDALEGLRAEIADDTLGTVL